MAQLKDLIVTGNSSFGGNVILDHAPTTDLEAATKKYVDDAIPSNNITGSGTSGYLTKWNGTNIITDGPQLGSNTTTFLRNDGTWATPAGGTAMVVLTYGTSTWNDFLTAYTNNAIVYCAVDGSASFPGSKRMAFLAYYNPDDSAEFQYVRSVSSLSSSNLSDQVFIYKLMPNDTWTTTTRSLHGKVSAGTAITVTPSGDAVTVAHTDTSSQASVSNSGRTYIQSVTLDDFGHVTGLSSATETVTIPANNITGSGTSGSLAKFSGANTLTDGPAFNTSATAGNFLTEKGTWERPLGKVFKGQCDTAAATTTKQVTCPEFTANDLVTGAIVFVTFKYTNSGAVASIKLSVNGTTAKNIKYMASAAESNLPGTGYLRANMTYRFVYNGTYWVCDTHYDANSNTIGYQIRNQYAPRYVANNGTANSSLYRYKLCFTNKNNELVPTICVSGQYSSAYRAMNTAPFDPFRGIRYYTTDATIAAGSVTAATGLWQQYTVNATYGFNIADGGLTANQPVFLKAKYDFNAQQAYFDPTTTGTQLSMSSLTQALPATNPGVPTFTDGTNTWNGIYIYIYLGTAYNGYQFELFLENPVYAWNPETGRTEIFSGQPFAAEKDEYIIEVPNLTIGTQSTTSSGGDALAAAITAGKKIIAKIHAKNLAGTTTGTTPYIYIPMTGAEYFSHSSQWKVSFEISNSTFTDQNDASSYLSSVIDLGTKKYKLVITCAAADAIAYDLTANKDCPFLFEIPDNWDTTGYPSTITDDSVHALRQAVKDSREIKIKLPLDPIYDGSISASGYDWPVIYLSQTGGYYFDGTTDNTISLIFTTVVPYFYDAASYLTNSILTVKLDIVSNSTYATAQIGANQCICTVTLKTLPDMNYSSGTNTLNITM